MRNGKKVFLATRDYLILDFNSYDEMDKEINKVTKNRFSNTMFWIPADAKIDGL